MVGYPRAESKVCHLYAATAGEQNVLCLQVSMYDIGVVLRGEIR